MNERIKELAEQARHRASDLTQNVHKARLLFEQEFARLIVKECAETIQNLVDHRVPASEYPKTLKKHFGVE